MYILRFLHGHESGKKPWTDDYTGKSGRERLFTCINCVSDIGYELNKRPETVDYTGKIERKRYFTCTFCISGMSHDFSKGLRTVDYTGKIGRKRLFTCTNSIFGMSWESSESPGMTIFNLWLIRLTLSGMRAIRGQGSFIAKLSGQERRRDMHPTKS